MRAFFNNLNNSIPINISVCVITVLIIFITGCTSQNSSISEVKVPILVVGGSTSGTTAAIQAARMGHEILVVESSEWLGGMLTAAGVSAIDGNHKLPSGLWGEFRDRIYSHYGGADSVSTGWVSNTLFEPDVGEKILRDMVAAEPNISVRYGYYVDSVKKVDSRITEVTFTNLGGKKIIVNPEVVIEATEYGDVIARAGEQYSIGLEPQSETGEPTAPKERLPWPQDMTYVATLEKAPSGREKVMIKPPAYNPETFNCVCAEVCDNANIASNLLSCEKMLNYGQLPSNKFMLNWPNNGNDTYLEILGKPHKKRLEILEKAKNKTLSFIYFLQEEAGFPHLRLAGNMYPSIDNLPLKPYIRESRRMYGQIRLRLPDISDPYQNKHRPLYKASIAVGDYPIDHHRRLNPKPLTLDFPNIPSYSVPYNVLLPQNTSNLIVAEKSISVTSLVNGTTRLQPVVMQIGQAAGLAAAIATKRDVKFSAIDIRILQSVLLETNFWLMPYMDTNPDQPSFKSIQKVGLAGWMRGEGISVGWANETRFYPDSVVTIEQLKVIANRMNKKLTTNNMESNTPLDFKYFLNLLYQMQHDKAAPSDAVTYYQKIIPSYKWFKTDRKKTLVKRKDVAIWLDAIFKPFDKPLNAHEIIRSNSVK